jgi:hypothetical protein
MHRGTGLLGAAALGVMTLVGPAHGQQRAPSLLPVTVPASLGTLEFSSSSLVWLDDSTLALIDSDAKQLVTASVRTGAMRRIGRAGGGPGEFRAPTFLLARGGRLLVDDVGARRLNQFDAHQKFVASTPTGGATLHLLDWQGPRVRLAWVAFTPGSGPVVSDFDLATGTRTDRFGILERDSSLSFAMPGVGTPSPFLALAMGRSGQFVAGSPQGYRLTVFDSAGHPLTRFGRELPAVFATDAEVEARVAQTSRMMAGTPLSASQRSDLATGLRETMKSTPKSHFSMGSIAVDSGGRIWVATARGGTSTEFDFFGPAGAFLGTTSVPDRVRGFAVRLPYVAVFAERMQGDDEGFWGIDLYRVGPPK